MAALEDRSFYCVDNLPAQLVDQFLDLCAKASSPIEKIALAIDAREEPFLRRFPSVIEKLRGSGARVDTLFLECSDEELQNRYRETRRVHPLSPDGSVVAGIEQERRLLAELAQFCDFEIDTSGLNVHRLKEKVVQLISGEPPQTVVNIISFGFRWGIPHSSELLFDVRFLPNPYFEEDLRKLSGLDEAVSEFVLKSDRGARFFERLCEFVGYLIPNYDEEGKAYITVALGCTGGHHRSVALACALASFLAGKGREVNLEHRDVEKDG